MLGGYVLGLPSRQAVITGEGALELLEDETNDILRLFFPKQREPK